MKEVKKTSSPCRRPTQDEGEGGKNLRLGYRESNPELLRSHHLCEMRVNDVNHYTIPDYGWLVVENSFALTDNIYQRVASTCGDNEFFFPFYPSPVMPFQFSTEKLEPRSEWDLLSSSSPNYCTE